MSGSVLRVGFVPGVTPDTWARSWRERRDGVRLELVPLEDDDAEAAVRSARVDMVLARLPLERTDLHLVRLYEEITVVVVPREHPVAAYDEIDLADLAAEQVVTGPPHGSDPAGDHIDVGTLDVGTVDLGTGHAKEIVDIVAAGTGVALMPMSVARLHHRRDVVHRPVRDAPTTPVVLAWRVDRDDEVTQAFVGVVRGRTARSSRG